MELRRAISPLLLAAGASEAAVRLLAPAAPGPDRISRADEHFTAAEIARGRRFGRRRLGLSLLGGVVQFGVLSALARGRSRAGPLPEPTVSAGARRAALAGTLEGAELSLALAGSSVPVAMVARRQAIRAGLDTQSWPGWAADVVRATVIEVLFAAVGGASVRVAVQRWPGTWWAPAAVGSLGAGALLATAAPVVLDPAFNDFAELPEGAARGDVLRLAEAAGVRVGKVLSVDASRRTTAANAYVAGLGPTKRVVLFDTLLDRYTPEEVRLVVAHELAHVRHRDVLRSLGFAAIVVGPVVHGAARLGPRWSGPSARDGISLPALALAAGVVSAPAGVLANRLSRAAERRADAFAIRAAGSGAAESFVSFHRRIALQNVGWVDPPRWLTALIATHPPVLERISAARAAAAAGTGAA